MIEQVDFHVRLITIGAGLMILALVMANEVRAQIKLPLAGMIIGAIFYLINASPLMMNTSPLDPVIDLFSISTPFWIWLFARHLFEREPEPRIIMAVVGVLLFGWVLGNFVPWTWPAGFLILHFVLLGLIGDVVRVGLFERDDDLVEQRRIIRLWLPALFAAQAAAILVFELFELFSGLDGQLPVANLVNSVLILLINLFAGLALLRTDPVLLVETQEQNTREDIIPALDLSPSEAVLHEKLTAAMKDGAYRTPGLTISALAEQLDTPEHRLRALINQRLGHRNFSAFLNRHRIAEAQGMLSSREHVDLPVLTIAMDLGYNSLPPFNRAFRSETGTSPSEYRKRAFIEDPIEPPELTTGQN